MSNKFTRQDLINAAQFNATFTKRDGTLRTGNFIVVAEADQRFGDTSPIVTVRDIDQGGAYRSIDATTVSELTPTV